MSDIYAGIPVSDLQENIQILSYSEMNDSGIKAHSSNLSKSGRKTTGTKTGTSVLTYRIPFADMKYVVGSVNEIDVEACPIKWLSFCYDPVDYSGYLEDVDPSSAPDLNNPADILKGSFLVLDVNRNDQSYSNCAIAYMVGPAFEVYEDGEYDPRYLDITSIFADHSEFRINYTAGQNVQWFVNDPDLEPFNKNDICNRVFAQVSDAYGTTVSSIYYALLDAGDDTRFILSLWMFDGDALNEYFEQCDLWRENNSGPSGPKSGGTRDASSDPPTPPEPLAVSAYDLSMLGVNWMSPQL